VNYLPYIGQYLIEELKIYGSFFDPNNSTLGLVLNQIPRTNILEVSIDGLTGFYRGRVRLTKSVKDILSDNLLRFLMGKRETSDGLKYSRISFRSCLKLFLIPWFAVYSTSPKLLKVRHPLLMKEGF
jgi:hypothetical protein